MTDIELGATYRDVVSGYEGIATSKTTFLFACERVVLSKGHNPEKGEEVTAVFDAPQLELIKHPKKEVAEAIARATGEDKLKPAKTGGDRPMPSAER